MPRLAALSTTLAVCWRKSAACSSPLAMAARVFFTNVLIADFTDWFRSARTREMRRLRSADLPLCVFGFGTCSNSPLQENRSPPRGEARHYSRNHQPDTSAKNGPASRAGGRSPISGITIRNELRPLSAPVPGLPRAGGGHGHVSPPGNPRDLLQGAYAPGGGGSDAELRSYVLA